MRINVGPRLFRPDVGRVVIPAIASVGIALVLVILLAVLFSSLGLFGIARPSETLGRLFITANFYIVLARTFYFAAVTTFVAMVFGVPMAWLTERTNLPGRNFLRLLLGLGILIPGFFNAMGWQFMAHPRIGIINVWLRAHAGFTIDINTLSGMGFVQGLALATLVFVVAAPPLGAIDPTLEEGAEAHGLGMYSRVMSVTLPVIAPALVASALLTFMVALAVFDIPAVLGLSSKIVLYSTFVYSLVNPAGGFPAYDAAAASSLPMLVMAGLLSIMYYRFMRRASRYQVVSGKNYRSKRTVLGPGASLAAWSFIVCYLALFLVVPLVAVAWASLLPFFQPVSAAALKLTSLANYTGLLTPALWNSVWNTLIVATAAPTLAVLFSLAISWVITRQRGVIGRWFEVFAFLPLAVPGVIFVVGAILIALAVGRWFPIYGTIWLIVVVEAVVHITTATRITNGAMLQIHNELDEAGSVHGLSAVTRFTRIFFPLLFPAVAYCWFFLAVLAYRDLTVPVMLVAPDSVTLSVHIWGLLGTGTNGPASALTMLVLLTIVIIGCVAAAAYHVINRFRAASARVEIGT